MVPLATLVSAHAASSVSWGETSLAIKSISLGTRLASITGCMGGPVSTLRIFLRPVTPQCY